MLDIVRFDVLTASDYGKYYFLECVAVWSGRNFTDVSEEGTSHIYRAEEKLKQISSNQEYLNHTASHPNN
jgi:hypothetical protein